MHLELELVESLGQWLCLVLKRGLVGAWAFELNSVLGTSTGCCMYSPVGFSPGLSPGAPSRRYQPCSLSPWGC